MPVDKSHIGKTGGPVVMHVERGKIREFATAIKDDDPIYFDEAYASKEAGGIMPPVTFLQTVSHWDDGRGRVGLPFDLKRVLHGEQEFEFREVLRPSDVLLTTGTLESRSVRGKNELFVIRTDSVNQHGRLAVRGRFTAFVRGAR